MNSAHFLCYPKGSPPAQEHLDLREAIVQEDPAAMIKALAAGASPLSHDCDAMRLAAATGGEPCMKLLIAEARRLSGGSLSWGHRGCPSPLLVAVEHEEISCLRLLISEVEEEGDVLMALSWAANGGHQQSLRELMRHCDPSDDGWFALLEAATIGQAPCVEILMEDFIRRGENPSALQDFAEQARSVGRHLEASMLAAAQESIALAQSAPRESQGFAESGRLRPRL